MTKKKVDRPNRNLSEEERMKLYVPLLAQGMGTKKVSKATGIPLGTVKVDLWKLRGGIEQTKKNEPSTITPAITDGTPGTPPTTNVSLGQAITPKEPLSLKKMNVTVTKGGSLEWEQTGDRIGMAIAHLFGSTVKKNDPVSQAQAMAWADRWFKATMAKYGLMRYSQTNVQVINLNDVSPEVLDQIKAQVRAVVVAEVTEALGNGLSPDAKKEVDNLMSNIAPPPANGAVIDVPFVPVPPPTTGTPTETVTGTIPEAVIPPGPFGSNIGTATDPGPETSREGPSGSIRDLMNRKKVGT